MILKLIYLDGTLTCTAIPGQSEKGEVTAIKVYFAFFNQLIQIIILFQVIISTEMYIFINAHHSVYSNRCFYQVINICCWQNILFS